MKVICFLKCLLRKLHEALPGSSEVSNCADRSGLIEQDDDKTPTDPGTEERR